MRSWFHASQDDGFRFQRHFAMMRSLQARQQRGGGRPAAVTIGASDLSMDFPDYADAIKDPTKWTFVFVEPIDWLLPSLRERVRSLGAGDDQVHIINAAVCNSSTGSLNLHTIQAAAIDEYNLTALKKELSHLSSLERGVVKKGIRESAIIPAHLKSVLERKVRAMPVRCVTPASLLLETQVSPEALELLIVDAEGADVAVLRPFLAMEGFAPSVVKFEWINMERRWTDLAETIQELASRGYNVRQEFFDLVAVSTRWF